jgi:hypothetical protein
MVHINASLRITEGCSGTLALPSDPRSREPLLVGYGAINHPDLAEALGLYTLYHRVVMWSHLRAADILRDLNEMSLRA